MHRRLSIIDVTEGGWQPMSSVDGRFHIVFNGELYNYVELRDQLAAEGVLVDSASDTAVLLAAFTTWGTSGLTRLRGMFAFAVLDVVRREVTLVRDQFGIKPLYVRDLEGTVGFASEPRPLLELGDGRPAADPRSVYDYLRYGRTDHRSQTMFVGIRQVPPGHFAVVAVDDPFVVPRAYWRVPDIGPEAEISADDAAAEVRRLLERSVEMHLRSDVPLGTALSGGIDSSVIVNLIRAIDPEARIRAFTYASGDAFDESRWAEVAAAAAGASLAWARPSSSSLIAEVQALVAAQGEPFGSTSIYAQSKVFELASEQGIKVMLDGQGADEVFGGYHPHVAERLAGLVAARDLRGAATLLRRRGVAGGRTTTLVVKAIARLSPTDPGPLRRLFGEEILPEWLDEVWFAERGVRPRPPRDPRVAPDRMLRSALRHDLCTTLPALLRFEDRNSMRVSVESRVPFLEPDLVAFVLSLPDQLLVGADGTTKRILREAARAVVPKEILARKEKIGFFTPEETWLREARRWVTETLESDRARSVMPLRIERVQRHWRHFVDGSAPFSPRFWRWVNLVAWAETNDVDFGGR